MFVFYHLFHRCITVKATTPSGSSSSTPPESSFPSSASASDRALLVWFTIFGISLLFRPAVELVIRFLFFSACTLFIATFAGSLNLLIGHAVLRAAKYNGYEPLLFSSVAAGSLGGIIVIGPTALATVYLIALCGGLKLQKALSIHIAFLIELGSVIAVSAAACSLGVTIMPCTRCDSGSPLDATHAARAGAIGACIFTVPMVLTVSFLIREAQTMMPSTRNESITPSPYLGDNLEYPVNRIVSSPQTRPHRHVIAHTAAETVGYALVTLCILTIRLLCF